MQLVFIELVLKPLQSTIIIAAVQTAIAYEYRYTEYRYTEYRCTEYRSAEYEYDEIRCDARTYVSPTVNP